MENPAVRAKQLVDLARKHIEDQQCRLVRQRELMAKYERDDDIARLSEARRVLEKMQNQLAHMTAAHVAAEEHLATLTVDEASVEKVIAVTAGEQSPGAVQLGDLAAAIGSVCSNRTYKPWSLSTETTRRPFDVETLLDIAPILATGAALVFQRYGMAIGFDVD
jgi:hypothetical protein